MEYIWNIYAKAYDKINQNIPYLELIDEVIKTLKLKPRQRILDLGAGTCNLARAILAQFPDLKICCLDFSPAMLKLGKLKFQKDKNIEFVQSDIDQGLKFPRGSFDKIVSINTFYALKKPQEAITECYRILKSGGLLVIANPHNDAKLSKIFSSQRKKMGTKKFLMSFFLNFPYLLVIILINQFFLRKYRNFYDDETLRVLFRKSGFQKISSRLAYAKQDILISGSK